MKLSTLLLVSSVAANAVLITWFARSRPSPLAVAAEATASAPRTAASAAKAQAGPGQPSDDPVAEPAGWDRLQTDDLRAFTARLRLAGFPPAAVRAMVNELLKEKFAGRRKAILGNAGVYEFWKPTSNYTSGYAADPKLRSALRDLTREQSNLAKELLGPDTSPEAEFGSIFRRRQYGALPREKAEQVTQIAEDYADLISQTRNAASGMILPEDREKIAYLEAEKRKDLAQLLTPEELADYEVRSSNTTNQLRYRLASLDLDEAQFRAIYALQKPFDEKYNPAGGGVTISSAEMMATRREEQEQIAAKIKDALGEDLALKYERANDPDFQGVSGVVNRLNLPKDAIQSVLGVKKDIEQRATQVRMDPAVPMERKRELLAVLAKEATAQVAASLGERGVAVYKENGGYWITNLAPPTLPARP